MDFSNSSKAEPPPLDVSVYFVLSMITIGTIGNILVCLAIYLNKKLQTRINSFLLSLAVADFLINLLVLPSRIASYTYVMQPTQFPLCYIYLVADDFLSAASAIHICVMSMERYFAVKNPFWIKSLTKRSTYYKIICVWLVSLFFIVPYLSLAILTDVTGKFPNSPQYCPTLPDLISEGQIITYLEFSLIFLMMAIVILSFIATMCLLLKTHLTQKSAKNEDGLVRTVGGKKTESISKNQNMKVSILKSEKKAMLVIWLVSFAFVISMGPYAIVAVIYSQDKYLLSPYPAVVKAGSYLTYGNSVINPIIYSIFNKKFRNTFKNIILCRYKNI